MTEDELNNIKELYEASISNFEKYLELSPEAKDKSDVEAQIAQIKDHMTKKQKPEE